jgi:hypothetical protein
VADFLQEAPTGALVLLFIALPLIFVSGTVRVIKMERRKREAATPSPIQPYSTVRGLVAVEVIGWALFVSSLAWYVLA